MYVVEVNSDHNDVPHLAVSAEGDGLGLHTEHVPGGVLGVLSAHESLAAGLQRDPSQGGVRRGTHVATGSLAAWTNKRA